MEGGKMEWYEVLGWFVVITAFVLLILKILKVV